MSNKKLPYHIRLIALENCNMSFLHVVVMHFLSDTNMDTLNYLGGLTNGA